MFAASIISMHQLKQRNESNGRKLPRTKTIEIARYTVRMHQQQQQQKQLKQMEEEHQQDREYTTNLNYLNFSNDTVPSIARPLRKKPLRPTKMNRTAVACHSAPLHYIHSPFLVPKSCEREAELRVKSGPPLLGGGVLSGKKMKIIRISKSSELQKRPSSKKANTKSVNHLNLETSTQFTSIMIPAANASNKIPAAQQAPKLALLGSRNPKNPAPSNDYISHQQQQFRVTKNLIDQKLINLPASNRVMSAKMTNFGGSQPTPSSPHRFLEDILVQGKRSSVTNTGSGSSGSLQLPTNIVIVNRSSEERTLFPDKLIMEKKNLACCPVIEGENSFKLINYQHNQIKSISNLEQMRNLIFLDLYNNHIEHISGLSSLVQLRVLMLGKNRISKIENLNTLVFLDILDLHANQISKIENLRSLHELRVLNLAANQIKTIENLSGLESLIELNLRRNEISEGKDFNYCPKLQRLYLSYNEIKSLTSLRSLEAFANLHELSLDNNPVCALEVATYKRDLLAFLPSLRKLDMRRITEEEKRVAERAWARELSKRREMTEAAQAEERKKVALKDAESEWMSQTALDEKIKIVSLSREGPAQTGNNYGLGMVVSSSSSSSIVSRSSNLERETTGLDDSATDAQPAQATATKLSPSRSSSASNVRSSSLAIRQQASPPATSTPKKCISLNGGANILEENVMSFLGTKSLDILDVKIEPFIVNQVQAISFNYIEYEDILAKGFAKIKSKFPNASALVFSCCNLKSLQQLDSLADWKRLDSVSINKKDNPIVDISLWRAYLINRLSSLQLKRINEQQISADELVVAEKMFSPVRNLALCLPEYRLLGVLGAEKKKLIKQAKDQGQHAVEANQAREAISKAVVQDHVKSVKFQQHPHKQLLRSNSLSEACPHTLHRSSSQPGVKSNGLAQKPTAGGGSSSSCSASLLQSVYSQIAYDDLKLRKIEQVRDQLWSQFLHWCLAISNESDAHVLNLCKKYQISF